MGYSFRFYNIVGCIFKCAVRCHRVRGEVARKTNLYNSTRRHESPAKNDRHTLRAASRESDNAPCHKHHTRNEGFKSTRLDVCHNGNFTHRRITFYSHNQIPTARRGGFGNPDRRERLMLFCCSELFRRVQPPAEFNSSCAQTCGFKSI